MSRANNIDDVWQGIDRRGPDECWPWLRFTSDGYGRFRVRGNPRRAHCVAFESATGINPHGRVVRHTCDNRLCCNPAHLLLGSVADNNRDMIERGRHRSPNGERGTNAKLSDAEAMEIKASREGSRALAKRFGVHRSTIQRLRAGKHTWKHLPALEAARKTHRGAR